MSLNKFIISILFILFNLTVFGQTKYDPIKIQVDIINPVYAIVERTSPNGHFKEKILKTDKERIKQIQQDKTLESLGYEFVNIDQVVPYWIKKLDGSRICCFGPESCKVWVLVEKQLVYTDSIRLYKEQIYKEQKLVYIDSQIFPNPAANFLNISSNSEILRAKIFDILGQEVFQIDINDKRKNIPLKHLPIGNYTIQLEFQNEVRSHKFIKS